MTLLDKEYPVYSGEEAVRVQVDFTAREACKDMAIRMTVFSAEGAAVGMATSMPCLRVTEGKNRLFTELPLDWVAPGKYLIKLVMYSVNQYGGEQLHDVVENCFGFKKMQKNQSNEIVWRHNYWGYVMFPVLQIEM